MEEELKHITDFKLLFDKAPVKWSGSISLKQNHAWMHRYVTSTKDSCLDAITEIIDQYRHLEIVSIDLKKTKEL